MKSTNQLSASLPHSDGCIARSHFTLLVFQLNAIDELSAICIIPIPGVTPLLRRFLGHINPFIGGECVEIVWLLFGPLHRQWTHRLFLNFTERFATSALHSEEETRIFC